jgi:peptidyl-prolyl cis-trans isomerase A (cyclophilin A)
MKLSLFLFAAVLFAQERPAGLYATIDVVIGSEPAGSTVLQLFEKEAPLTVKNFLDLVEGRKAYLDPRTGLPNRRPLFNGLTFHRVVKGFMIQGGDPLADGTGGTAIIPDEIVPELRFDRAGRLAMANSGPNSGSCQFFITEGGSEATQHLNGLHTIFGQVLDGQDVVSKVTALPVDDERPETPVTIKAVRIERVPAGAQ